LFRSPPRGGGARPCRAPAPPLFPGALARGIGHTTGGGGTRKISLKIPSRGPSLAVQKHRKKGSAHPEKKITPIPQAPGRTKPKGKKPPACNPLRHFQKKTKKKQKTVVGIPPKSQQTPLLRGARVDAGYFHLFRVASLRQKMKKKKKKKEKKMPGPGGKGNCGFSKQKLHQKKITPIKGTSKKKKKNAALGPTQSATELRRIPNIRKRQPPAWVPRKRKPKAAIEKK